MQLSFTGLKAVPVALHTSPVRKEMQMCVVVQSWCCVSSISDIRHKEHAMDRTYMNVQVEKKHVCAWECMSKVQEKPGSGVLQFRNFVTRTKGKEMLFPHLYSLIESLYYSN